MFRFSRVKNRRIIGVKKFFFLFSSVALTILLWP